MLFNRNLNVLGNVEHARLEELPLERFNVEEIPLEGEIVEEHAGSVSYTHLDVYKRQLFHTFVRAWKYTEPDPLYGKYTTKEWTRYIIECQPDIEPADAFVYRNEAFTLYSKEELERLVGILHGKLFNG